VLDRQQANAVPVRIADCIGRRRRETCGAVPSSIAPWCPRPKRSFAPARLCGSTKPKSHGARPRPPSPPPSRDSRDFPTRTRTVLLLELARTTESRRDWKRLIRKGHELGNRAPSSPPPGAGFRRAAPTGRQLGTRHPPLGRRGLTPPPAGRTRWDARRIKGSHACHILIKTLGWGINYKTSCPAARYGTQVTLGTYSGRQPWAQHYQPARSSANHAIRRTRIH